MLFNRIAIRILLFIDQTVLHDHWHWLCDLTCQYLNEWHMDLDGNPIS